MKRVEIRTLRPGRAFRLREGVQGRLIEVGLGAATVELERNEVREFTPQTGPNAGQTVTITTSKERTTWSLAAEVEVLD